MVNGSGVFPKADGDVLYSNDVNILHNRSQPIKTINPGPLGSAIYGITPVSGNVWYGLEYNTGHIWVTTDSGGTWTEACSGAWFKCIDICRQNPYLAIAVGSETSKVWTCNYADNNGSPWYQRDTPPMRVMDVDFVGSELAWISMGIAAAGSTSLAYSKDTGSTWILMTSGTARNLTPTNAYAHKYYTVNFYDNDHGFFISDQDEGTVFYTANAGSSWTYCGSTALNGGFIHAITGSSAVIFSANTEEDVPGSAIRTIFYLNAADAGNGKIWRIYDPTQTAIFDWAGNPFVINGSHHFPVQEGANLGIMTTVDGKSWENKIMGISFCTTTNLSDHYKSLCNDRERYVSGGVLLSMRETGCFKYLNLNGGF